MRFASVIFVMFLGLQWVSAQTTDCANPSVIVADGRITNTSFAAGQNSGVPYWYVFAVQASHSYVIEFVPTTDNEAPNGVGISVYAPGVTFVGCRTQSSPMTLMGISYISPPVTIQNGGYGAGRRFSFTPVSAGVYWLSLVCYGGTGVSFPYSYRIVDTTLFGPHWTTWSWYTEFSVTNTSDMTVQGTFYFYDESGAPVGQPITVTIPAGGILRRTTRQGDLGLPPNNGGYVYFAHNAPPGVLIGDAFMANNSLTISIPTKFEARRN